MKKVKRSHYFMSDLPYSLQCAQEKERERIKEEEDRTREQNKSNRHLRVGEMATMQAEWEAVGIECIMLTPFHYRLSKGNYIVDYFPTSGKYHDIKQKLWDVIEPSGLVNLFPDVITWREELN